MLEITYYPGCTLTTTAFEYGDSTITVLNKLGVTVKEIPDWNCCGAASAKSLDHRLSILIPARNIKNAVSLKNDIYVPCAGCYNNLMKAKRAIEDDEKRAEIEKELNYTFNEIPKIYPLMNLFLKDEIMKVFSDYKFKESVKIASYYGCAFLRPEEVLKNEHPELPKSLDSILANIGIDTIDWPLKNFCCGGDLSLADPSIVTTLVDKIIIYAKEAGAEAIVTACPLCQANLEMRQSGDFPVFYFTEILGIALSIDKNIWWKKHLIDPSKIVEKLKRAKR